MMRTNGSGLTALTNTPDLDPLAGVLPNGAKVVFERDTADFTLANVVIVDSRGLNQTSPRSRGIRYRYRISNRVGSRSPAVVESQPRSDLQAPQTGGLKPQEVARPR